MQETVTVHNKILQLRLGLKFRADRFVFVFVKLPPQQDSAPEASLTLAPLLPHMSQHLPLLVNTKISQNLQHGNAVLFGPVHEKEKERKSCR